MTARLLLVLVGVLLVFGPQTRPTGRQVATGTASFGGPRLTTPVLDTPADGKSVTFQLASVCPGATSDLVFGVEGFDGTSWAVLGSATRASAERTAGALGMSMSIDAQKFQKVRYFIQSGDTGCALRWDASIEVN
jgi:hypothetical protein